MITLAPSLPDVKAAFDAIPTAGSDTLFAGTIRHDIDGNTHIQGLAAQRDYFLLTHSDKSRNRLAC